MMQLGIPIKIKNMKFLKMEKRIGFILIKNREKHV